MITNSPNLGHCPYHGANVRAKAEEEVQQMRKRKYLMETTSVEKPAN
jgi:hypothetical protein